MTLTTMLYPITQLETFCWVSLDTIVIYTMGYSDQ